MRRTYRLAIVRPFDVLPFGPLMTLPEAESYRDQMRAKGFASVVVVNVESV
jgi:hypothetical protein